MAALWSNTFRSAPSSYAFTSDATTKVTGPNPREKVNMKTQSQTRTTLPLPQSQANALPTIIRLMVTRVDDHRNSGRRPILTRFKVFGEDVDELLVNQTFTAGMRRDALSTLGGYRSENAS